jgi:hypothetical protein
MASKVVGGQRYTLYGSIKIWNVLTRTEWLILCNIIRGLDSGQNSQRGAREVALGPSRQLVIEPVDMGSTFAQE